MRRLLLLAAGIGAALFVRRRAAEEGVTAGTFLGNALQQALGRLMPERGDAPAAKSAGSEG